MARFDAFIWAINEGVKSWLFVMATSKNQIKSKSHDIANTGKSKDIVLTKSLP